MRRRRERGVKGAWRLPLICHKDGRHVMIANVEQIGLEEEEEEERQGKGERRQMAKLAWCQRYQDMTTQGNLPLHSDTCCCLCVHVLGIHVRTNTVAGNSPTRLWHFTRALLPQCGQRTSLICYLRWNDDNLMFQCRCMLWLRYLSMYESLKQNEGER